MSRLTILLTFLVSLNLSAQKELFNYVKVWNFMKYYHPDLASGKKDADSLFVAHIPKDNDDFNRGVSNLTKELSISKTLDSKPETSKDILDKNQNFNWFLKSKSLSKENKKRLENIFTNRWTKAPHHYVPQDGFTSDLPNEKEYPVADQENLSLELRLLTMAKIWGVMDYLYPHQYLMTIDAETKFENYLHQSINANSKKDFEEILVKTVSLFEDTHAFRFYNQLKYKADIFHTHYFAPFDYQIVNDYMLITKIVDPLRFQNANLNIGDRIYSINGKTIPQILSEKSNLLSTSNSEGLRHRLSDYQTNLIWSDDLQTKTLKVQKKNTKNFFTTSVEMLNPKEKSHLEAVSTYLKSKIQTKQNHQLKNSEVAYFRIDQTFGMIEEVEDQEIDKKMKQILDTAASKKALVFDMRGYPDWGGFVYHYIYSYFSPKENYFGKYYQQNLNSIGTFKYVSDSKTYFPEVERMNTNPYTGKVFIIVNQETLSASEWNTMNLQNTFPLAITIGEQTAGADGDIKKMKLPGGYTLEFTGNGIFYPNGQQTQKVGVHINKKTHYTDSDILIGKDVAFDFIQSQLSKP